MVQLTLPRNSKIGKGRKHAAPAGAGKIKTFRVYRYDPESPGNPAWDDYEVDVEACGPMVLDVLIHIKNTIDATLAFRRSCREGVCGSCAMNIGGRNTLACTHGWAEVPGAVVRISPLPHLPVVRATWSPTSPSSTPSTPPSSRGCTPQPPRPGASGCNRRRSALNSTASTNASSAPAAPPPAPATGGTTSATSDPPPCSRPAAGWSTAATRPPASASTDWKTRSSFHCCHTPIMNCAQVSLPSGLNPAQAIAGIKSMLVERVASSAAPRRSRRQFQSAPALKVVEVAVPGDERDIGVDAALRDQGVGESGLGIL